MPDSTFLNGFPYHVTLRGVPILNLYTGKVFWVNSNGPAGNGLRRERPLASIAAALLKCSANRGDIIICEANHVETVSAATSCVLNIAGVCVVFLGQGSKKATINLTATGAYVDVTAINCAMIGPRFLTGIDAVAKGILVEAADFFLGGGVEYYDAAAKASTIQVLTTSAAARMVVDGYRYFPSTTGTQKTDGIKTVGALDGVVLKNIDIRGDFTGGFNVNMANAACTNIMLENLYLNNSNAGPVAALSLHANTTGFAKNVKCRVASGTTYVSSVAKLSWADDCEGFSTDGYAGEPLGTAVGTGLEGKVDTILTDLAVPTADATTNTLERDVIGNKTDAAVQAIAANKSAVGYLKGLIDALMGTAGIATFPTPGVAAGNGVSLAEVIRYIQENQIGTLLNSGGTADLANLIGDLANVSILTRFTNLQTQSTMRKKVISVDLAAADLTGTVTRFTVAGGPIRVLSLGLLITTVLPAGANTLQFSFTPTGGGATVLSGTTDTASAAVQSFFLLDGTKATGPVKTTDPGILAAGQLLAGTPVQGVLLSTGVIQTVFSAGPPATGAATLFMEYEPMTAAATVS